MNNKNFKNVEVRKMEKQKGGGLRMGFIADLVNGSGAGELLGRFGIRFERTDDGGLDVSF